MGGLPKKALVLKKIGEQGKRTQLRLDAGNLLFKNPVVGNGTNQEKLTASTIMQVYQLMHYDAVGIGPYDLSGGIDFLQTGAARSFPWVSANILDTQGSPIFRQWIKKTMMDVPIAITALTRTSKRIPKDVVITNWKSVLPELLKAYTTADKETFLIILSTLTTAENLEIAKTFPRINLIIGADFRQRNGSPKLYGHALVTQTEKQGKYQGVLEILFGSERKWGQDRTKELADLQNNLGSLNWQLRRLEKRAAAEENTKKYTISISRLKSEKLGMEEKIGTVQAAIADGQSAVLEPDRFEYRFIALKKNMANDGKIQTMLNKLNQQIRQLHSRKPGTTGQTPAGTKAISSNLAGSPTCGECHTNQFAFWQKTRHADAYKTLLNDDKNLNLDCLPCHVTRDLYSGTVNNEQSDRKLLSLPESLLSVGCETCHSPGKNHSVSPEQFQMAVRVEKGICLTCHTDDHDDNFIYETKLDKISCPKG